MSKMYLFIVSLTFVLMTLVLGFVQTTFVHTIESVLQPVLLYTVNTILFVLSIFAFIMHKKAIEANTNFQFMSKIMSVIGIRMIAIVFVICAYVIFSTHTIQLVSLLVTMLLYFVYTFIEMYFLLKGMRKNKLNGTQ